MEYWTDPPESMEYLSTGNNQFRGMQSKGKAGRDAETDVTRLEAQAKRVIMPVRHCGRRGFATAAPGWLGMAWDGLSL